MRATLLLCVFLTGLSPCWAQSQAPVKPPASQPDGKSVPAAAGQAARTVEQRTEHIQVEDAGARIDEIRVGGETKSISVQPKTGMPAYEVLPEHGTRTPPTVDRDGSSGSRVWKILGF